jgi:hypothetical protein
MIDPSAELRATIAENDLCENCANLVCCILVWLLFAHDPSWDRLRGSVEAQLKASKPGKVVSIGPL